MRNENATIQSANAEHRLRSESDVEGCAVAKKSTRLGLALLAVARGKPEFGRPRLGTLHKDQAILGDFEQPHVALVDHEEHQGDEEVEGSANDKSDAGDLLDHGDCRPTRCGQKNGVVIEGLDSLVGDEDEMLHRVVEPCRRGYLFHNL